MPHPPGVAQPRPPLGRVDRDQLQRPAALPLRAQPLLSLLLLCAALLTSCSGGSGGGGAGGQALVLITADGATGPLWELIGGVPSVPPVCPAGAGLRAWAGCRAPRRVPVRAAPSGAALRIHRRPGEPVAAGEPLFTLDTDTPERFDAAVAELDGGWSVGDTPPQAGGAPTRRDRPLILDRITP